MKDLTEAYLKVFDYKTKDKAVKEFEQENHQGLAKEKRQTELHRLSDEQENKVEEIDKDAIIQKALENLENADIAEYFDEMDKIEMPSNKKDVYNSFKQKFWTDNIDQTFSQKLKVFAKDCK